MFRYKAKIIKVYDGDTFTFEVDLGFSVTITEKLRLHEIDTPELRGEERAEGIKVRDYVIGLILNKEFEIQVYKKGKYGRYIADLFLEDGSTLTEHLLTMKMGTEVHY